MSDAVAHLKTAPADPPWRITLWLGSAALLVLLTLATALGGWQDAEGTLWALQGLGMIAGGVYLLSLWLGPRGKKAWQVVILLGVAVAMRLPMWSMPPGDGWDYWRYLWDGAVTASGVSPYRYSPEALANGEVTDERLQQLRQGKGAHVLRQINYPHLRTIYPPVAQGLFAAAYWLKPFSLTSWRLVLLGFDVLAAAVVLALLRASRQRWSLWAVYLWNPLLVGEAYYGGHLDLVVGALVILFAWAVVRRRGVLAALVLAAAVGVKVWPGLLVFFLWHAAGHSRRRLLLSVCVFIGLLAIIMAPYLMAFGPESSSGLLSYAKNWRSHSGVYQLSENLGWWLRWKLSLKLDGQVIARGFSMLLLLAVALWQGLRRTEDIGQLCAGIAVVPLVMLLLGPTLWPWYYIAIIPLAAVASDRSALLLWTVLLGLCYLPKDVLEGWAFVWVVHVPVWVLLGISWWRGARTSSFRREAGHV